jgi:hypothetical protein
MKFLNLKSKVVNFEVSNLHIWAKQHELEIDFELLSESQGVSVSKVIIGEVSTFHRESDVVYYCNDEFVFFEKSYNLFSDEVPVVKNLHFGRTKVNEDRIERLLLEINNLAAEKDSGYSPNGLNIWKAQSCELALAG